MNSLNITVMEYIKHNTEEDMESTQFLEKRGCQTSEECIHTFGIILENNQFIKRNMCSKCGEVIDYA